MAIGQREEWRCRKNTGAVIQEAEVIMEGEVIQERGVIQEGKNYHGG